MKEEALMLLKLAAILFPPLAELIRSAIDGVEEDHPSRPLVDEVRDILPSEGEIYDAVKKLQDKRGPNS